MGAMTPAKGEIDNGQLGERGREGEPRETNSFPFDLLPAPPTGGTRPEVGSEGYSPSRPVIQATEEGLMAGSGSGEANGKFEQEVCGPNQAPLRSQLCTAIQHH